MGLREVATGTTPSPPPLQAPAGDTHLLRNAASSSSSTCFICRPRSREMLSALAWPWEMICRGEG